MSGFVVMHRDAADHHLFEGDVARLGAWLWLIAKSCWKPTKFNIGGKTVMIERGQICASRSQLSKAWGMSPSAVERFLARLETEQMIGRESGQGRSIITICNYDKYQDISGEAGQATGQATGQVSDSDRTTKEQGNKGTNISSEAKASSDTSSGDDTPDLLEAVEAKPDPVSEAISAWKASAKQCGWPIPMKLSAERRKRLRARLREHGIDGWMAALTRASRSEMLGRDPPRWWDFDFLVRSEGQITKVLEGKYDEQFGSPASAKPQSGISRTQAAAASAMDDIERIFEASSGGNGGCAGGSGPYGPAAYARDRIAILGPDDGLPDPLQRRVDDRKRA